MRWAIAVKKDQSVGGTFRLEGKDISDWVGDGMGMGIMKFLGGDAGGCVSGDWLS